METGVTITAFIKVNTRILTTFLPAFCKIFNYFKIKILKKRKNYFYVFQYKNALKLFALKLMWLLSSIIVLKYRWNIKHQSQKEFLPRTGIVRHIVFVYK